MKSILLALTLTLMTVTFGFADGLGPKIEQNDTHPDYYFYGGGSGGYAAPVWLYGGSFCAPSRYNAC